MPVSIIANRIILIIPSFIKLAMNKLQIQGVSEFKYGMKLILYSIMVCSTLTNIICQAVPLKAVVEKCKYFCGTSPANLFTCNISKSFEKSPFISLNK